MQQLGRPGGFSSDPNVRIELPGNIGKASRMLKMVGMGPGRAAGKQHEPGRREGRAAGSAIAARCRAQDDRQDAKAILAGGDDSATQYLNKSSREQIRARFLPIVKQATDQVGLAQQYNAVAAKVRRA